MSAMTLELIIFVLAVRKKNSIEGTVNAVLFFHFSFVTKKKRAIRENAYDSSQRDGLGSLSEIQLCKLAEALLYQA